MTMESFVWQKKCVLLSVDPIISDARFVRVSEDCILDRGMGKGEFVFTDVKKKRGTQMENNRESWAGCPINFTIERITRNAYDRKFTVFRWGAAGRVERKRADSD